MKITVTRAVLEGEPEAVTRAARELMGQGFEPADVERSGPGAKVIPLRPRTVA